MMVVQLRNWAGDTTGYDGSQSKLVLLLYHSRVVGSSGCKGTGMGWMDGEIGNMLASLRVRVGLLVR